MELDKTSLAVHKVYKTKFRKLDSGIFFSEIMTRFLEIQVGTSLSLVILIG